MALFGSLLEGGRCVLTGGPEPTAASKRLLGPRPRGPAATFPVRLADELIERPQPLVVQVDIAATWLILRTQEIENLIVLQLLTFECRPDRRKRWREEGIGASVEGP